MSLRNRIQSSLPLLLGLPLAVALSGCKPDPAAIQAAHSHDHGDNGHAHGADAHSHGDADEIAFPFTVWTNGYEIFAEHGPIVAGEPMQFVTHITELETGEAWTDKPVHFTARDEDGESFDVRDVAPARTGIVLPQIRFPKAGQWNLTLLLPAESGLVRVPLPPVTVFADDAAAASATEPEEIEGISFLKEQQWKEPTVTRPVGTRNLKRRLTVPGIVEALPANRGAVTTPLSGRLLPPADGAIPTIGQTVKAGQIVARVQPVFSEVAARLAEARSAIEQATIRVEDARTTHDRVRKLAGAEAKSKKELQAAETELRLAESALKNARAIEAAFAATAAGLGDADADKLPTVALVAPIAGVVSIREPLAVGEFIAEGATLLRTLDSGTVRVHAHAPSSSAGSLTKVVGADIEPPGSAGEWIPIFDANRGRLVAIGPEVDTVARDLPVILETPASDPRVRVGLEVTVHLALDEAVNAPAVPDSALIEENGLRTVYVQVSGETFQKRVVKTGIRDAGWTQILAGVAAGERVVTTGAYAVRLASVAGGAVPSHHH